jgi:hypothetical protein
MNLVVLKIEDFFTALSLFRKHSTPAGSRETSLPNAPVFHLGSESEVIYFVPDKTGILHRCDAPEIDADASKSAVQEVYFKSDRAGSVFMSDETGTHNLCQCDVPDTGVNASMSTLLNQFVPEEAVMPNQSDVPDVRVT